MSQRPDPAIGYDPEMRAPAQADVSTEAVRAQLQLILASDLFLNALRPSQFLRFIVETTLSGNEGQIKEYLLGVEVFGRPSTYDPKDDPVVRIEAGRMRKKLAEYYSGPGVNDPVLIEVPRGGYIPYFCVQTSRTEPADARSSETEPALITSRPSKPILIGTVIILTTAIVLAAIYFIRLRHPNPATPTSIAVLPFLNLNPAPTQAYFTDGVAEELTTSLAQFAALRVVAATSAFQFRGKAEDVRKIGQSLNAEALLEGSIVQRAGSLRINAQLIDTRNGFHLWSKSYDVQAADLQACEQDITRETALALQIPVPTNPPTPKRDTENAEAHDLYLHGRFLWNTRQLPQMLESANLFERAIQDDPNYALAYAGLADTYTVMTINMQMSPAEALPKAKAALQRAIELDPNLARAHATQGLLESQCEWNREDAEREFHKAIALDPNYAPAHHWAALNYMQLGQFTAADAEFRAAQVLDPLSPMITEGRAENFYQAHRYDDAIAVVLNMSNPRVGWVALANSYFMQGNYRETLKLREVANPVDLNGYILRAVTQIRTGDRATGMKTLEEMGRNQHKAGTVHNYVPPAYLAWAYAVIGEKDRSLAWLQKATQQHDPTLANLKTDPGFDTLRDEPKFIEVMHKVGFAN